MNPQQGEEQLEVSDALGLGACNHMKRMNLITQHFFTQKPGAEAASRLTRVVLDDIAKSL